MPTCSVLPFPSRPEPPFPQEMTAPSLVIASEWELPQDSVLILGVGQSVKSTLIGWLESPHSVVPTPSCPYLLSPHAYKIPFAARTTVWWVPHEISTMKTLRREGINFGLMLAFSLLVGVVVRFFPSTVSMANVGGGIRCKLPACALSLLEDSSTPCQPSLPQFGTPHVHTYPFASNFTKNWPPHSNCCASPAHCDISGELFLSSSAVMRPDLPSKYASPGMSGDGKIILPFLLLLFFIPPLVLCIPAAASPLLTPFCRSLLLAPAVPS